LKSNRQHIVVFEHQVLKLNQPFEDGAVFDQPKLDALVKFFGKGVPYYKLINKGIQFNEFVGALQVGKTVIEVLPKADKRKADKDNEKKWRDVLIGMLKAVHGFDVKAPSQSDLKLKNNSVLDVYFELFVNEVEYLLHKGLVKKYRKTEGNLNALKGSLQFNKHISQNLVHKERFYTRYTTFDAVHILHIIIYRAIHVLKRINTNSTLIGKINSLLLNFPEMPEIKISEASFDNLSFNRKTLCYQKAIEIARLILLNFHPDLSKGRNDVLALMFDMNKLWEQFVLVTLKKNKELKVRGQNTRNFWKPQVGKMRNIKPDITIETENEYFVLDTKWKLVDNKPSMEDIRQMYAYHHYFDASKVALLYPGVSDYVTGKFVKIKNQMKSDEYECGLMFSEFQDSVRNWQDQLCDKVIRWIHNNQFI
jgi:5-methylcytosine-specific restriction enzyme subunit McrC